MPSKWQGTTKNLTKNCLDCKDYKKIKNEQRCYWGVVYKVLMPTEKPIKCGLTGKLNSNKKQEQEYKNNKFRLIKTYGEIGEKLLEPE